MKPRRFTFARIVRTEQGTRTGTGRYHQDRTLVEYIDGTTGDTMRRWYTVPTGQAPSFPGALAVQMAPSA